ncbi:MAG: amino acid carrier protein [Parachlamydia sp.]|nr:amino acid carrier protein [Parachlamydia sp.]
MEQLGLFLDTFENALWGYLGFPILMVLGLILTFQSRFIQFRKLPTVIKQFFSLLFSRDQAKRGVHPMQAFFAGVGGCVGVGNVVGICTAVQMGGPGALFWIWVTAIVGGMVKYAEVYLGMRYRQANGKGSYNGGPMYFLQRVFTSSWPPLIVCVLLCVYGVEIYQFSIVKDSLVHNWGFNQYAVIFSLLGLVLFAGAGGVRRVGNIASMIMPLFVLIYLSMGGWLLLQNIDKFPAVIASVFASAFSSHAAVGGFAGSTLLMTISQGVRRGCYSGDLGIGYASVIHAESSAQIPERQASLVIFEIFMDAFLICSASVLTILVTDVWHQPITTDMLVQSALATYFPYMNFFMPFLLFLLGYTTVNSYFCVGIKCAEYLSPKRGRLLYYVYAALALLLFSFVESSKAQ